jgi:hypothetical protein
MGKQIQEAFVLVKITNCYIIPKHPPCSFPTQPCLSPPSLLCLHLPGCIHCIYPAHVILMWQEPPTPTFTLEQRILWHVEFAEGDLAQRPSVTQVPCLCYLEHF